MSASFRVEGKTTAGDRLMILTSSKARAKKMALAMLQAQGYEQITVEGQGQVWIGQAIKGMEESGD